MEWTVVAAIVVISVAQIVTAFVMEKRRRRMK